MRRKRRVWYEASAKGRWWGGKQVGWISADMLGSTYYKSASSSRRFRTAKRAFAHAKTLPIESVLSKWYYKRGDRFMQEFIKTKRRNNHATQSKSK